MLLFVPAMAAEPEVAPGPVLPYYETDSLITTVWEPSARRQLARELRDAGLELFLERADGTQVAVRPSSPTLEDPVIATALVPFVHERPGAELDTVAQVTDTFLLLVTIRWDPGRYVISKARAPRGLQKDGPSEAALRQKWGIGALVEVDRGFDSSSLGLLDDALGLLTPAELPLVARLSFQRQSVPTQVPMDSDGILSAQYFGTAERRPGIKIYDHAIAPQPHFVGTPDAPRPYALKVVLHEIGHAIADAPSWTGRLLVEDLETAIAQDQVVLDGLPDADPRRAALVARLDARRAAIDAVRRQLGRGRQVEAAWSVAVADERAPTAYGRTNRTEGFAEAFALFHVDRAALERASPRSAAWFAAGGHLEAAEAATAELDALAAPGFRQP